MCGCCKENDPRVTVFTSASGAVFCQRCFEHGCDAKSPGSPCQWLIFVSTINRASSPAGIRWASIEVDGEPWAIFSGDRVDPRECLDPAWFVELPSMGAWAVKASTVGHQTPAGLFMGHLQGEAQIVKDEALGRVAKNQWHYEAEQRKTRADERAERTRQEQKRADEYRAEFEERQRQNRKRQADDARFYGFYFEFDPGTEFPFPFGTGARRGPPPPPEPFAVLGLLPAATRAEVVAAHRALAFRHHPDRGGDAEKLKAINVARDQILGEGTAAPRTH